MRTLARNILPTSLYKALQARKHLREWAGRGYSDHSPQFIKEGLFLRYGVEGAPWIETGTYLGTTTRFLAKSFPHVYTVEPSDKFYREAVAQFEGQNVEVINAPSEKALPELLPRLNGSLNFWLDGHYSAGETYKGETECPVEPELAAIAANLDHLDDVSILIDDVRLFFHDVSIHSDYPSLDYLVDWARANDFVWQIEHDIFIMKRVR
ncbi:MAG: hypothetical protein JKY00_07955 [Roseicyclus sp.]|nr:hypothetical protein [Roseicyclus sp.]